MRRFLVWACVTAVGVLAIGASRSIAGKPGAGNISVTAALQDRVPPTVPANDKIWSDGQAYEAFIDQSGAMSFDRSKLGAGGRTVNLNFSSGAPPLEIASCLWEAFPDALNPIVVEVALTVVVPATDPEGNPTEVELSGPCPDNPLQTCKGLLAMCPGCEYEARFKILIEDPDGRRRVCAGSRFTRWTVRFGELTFPDSTNVRVMRSSDLMTWVVDADAPNDQATLVLGNVPGMNFGTYQMPFEMTISLP